MRTQTLTIGQVARRAGVGVETVRFYEREGLLAKPTRRASGYRQYPDEVVARIRFIRRAQALGFVLREIADLLDLRSDPRATCADFKQRARDKIDELDEKIRKLGEMKQTLGALVSGCRNRQPVNECPIVAALDAEEEPGTGH